MIKRFLSIIKPFLLFNNREMSRLENAGLENVVRAGGSCYEKRDFHSLVIVGY